MGERDRGSSLVEVIVGISLMAIVLVGVVDASWTSTRVAAETRRRSAETSALIELGRVLGRAGYSPCPHIDGTYANDISTSPLVAGRFEVAITRYEYWRPSSSTWVDFSSSTQAQCSTLAELTDPSAVQRLMVSISESTRTVSAAFVKSNGLPL